MIIWEFKALLGGSLEPFGTQLPLKTPNATNTKCEYNRQCLLFVYVHPTASPLPTIKGKELPPPQKNKCYSNIEIIQLSLVHKKSSVIKAIHESSFGPKRAALYRCFAPQDEAFSNETVKSLLCKCETGSDEWKKTVNLISTNTNHSVCEEIIYNMLGIVKNLSSERMQQQAWHKTVMLRR
eukprot:scaffold14615_cov65-Cyclotella_meneghiniana.AAC.9